MIIKTCIRLPGTFSSPFPGGLEYGWIGSPSHGLLSSHLASCSSMIVSKLSSLNIIQCF